MTRDQYRIVPPNPALEEQIVEVFRQNGREPLPLSEVIARLDRSYEDTVRPKDSQVRHAIWRLIGEHRLLLLHDRRLELPKNSTH